MSKRFAVTLGVLIGACVGLASGLLISIASYPKERALIATIQGERERHAQELQHAVGAQEDRERLSFVLGSSYFLPQRLGEIHQFRVLTALLSMDGTTSQSSALKASCEHNLKFLSVPIGEGDQASPIHVFVLSYPPQPDGRWIASAVVFADIAMTETNPAYSLPGCSAGTGITRQAAIDDAAAGACRHFSQFYVIAAVRATAPPSSP